MSVSEDDLEEFQLALKHYVESASAQSGCLRISIQKLSNESRYMIYEFWENSSVWNRYVNNNLESLDDNMVQSIIMDMMDKGSLHGVETNQAGQWPRSREKRTYTKSLLGFQLQMQCPATEAQ
ncbi:hypothetical protein I79_015947 [Cricetulus griseus]|uniref:ABM domain-containing protein n=1 Tax=Cricetulus griseus TaxID=10029 RepID=G3HY30_CRIGR|nr:hypothetical protein I79_015947 [Cricetulus griseus]